MPTYKVKYTPICNEEKKHEKVLTKLLELKRWKKNLKQQFKEDGAADRQRLATRLFNSRKRTHILKKSVIKDMKEEMKVELSLFQKNLYLQTIKEAESDCLHLALTVAEQFLEKIIPTQKKELTKKITSEISQLASNKKVTVNVHNDWLEDVLKELEGHYPHCTVKTDDKIQPGTAEVETENGSLTINWKDEFSRYRRHVIKEFSKES